MDTRNDALTPDAQAILLLCATLGSKEDRPLTTQEYSKLAKWLHERQARPGQLLEPPEAEALMAQAPVEGDRLRALLARKALLALKVEEWTRRNIWVLTRGDSAYPRRYKQRLQHAAPPVLFGVGEVGLLESGGLAVVGSRDVDAAGLQFTRLIAQRCATEEMPVISGGARGVDEEAMLTALEGGGRAVGILANDMARMAVSKKYRQALLEGRLVMVTPYDPAAGFSVGNAMGRNKLVYALSDATVVVSSDAEKGGTWQGAKENLSAGWVPLFVRDEPTVPAGNRALLSRGAHPLTSSMVADQAIASWLNPVPTAPVPELNHSVPAESTGLFSVVWPHIAGYLSVDRTEQELITHFDVTVTQMRLWLAKALEKNLVEKVTLKKKAHYRLPSIAASTPNAIQQMSLFGS